MSASEAEHPRTRSRKREEAEKAAEESAQKRVKEQEQNEKKDQASSSEKGKSGKSHKPGKRREHREHNPLRKLTTGLLSTYNAINSLFHQRKKSGLRKCPLWQLIQTLDMHREMLYNRGGAEPAVAEEEMPARIASIKHAVHIWLRHHDYQHFNVELAYQKHLEPLPECSTREATYRAVDRFHGAVEKIKMARHTFEDQQGNYVCEVGETVGLHGRYLVEGLLGGGAFCKAWRALDRHTGNRVCMKVACNRKHCFEQSRREVKTLRYLNDKCPDVGVVKLRDAFVFREHQVLVFDPLAYDLYELLKREKFCGVSLKLVRKFAVQILQTLAKLSASTGLGLVHCDLKPENIMVVNQKRTTINVIDFGSSCFVGEHGSTYIQSRFYRSPEVLLGLPYDTQIDVWSFGCVLFEMYTGRPLFNGKDPEDQLMKIIALLGQPPEEMMKKRTFFRAGTKEGDRIASQQATRNFADRFRAVGYTCITRRKRADGVALVDDVKTDANGRVIDENLLQFIDLITKCLDIDPATRLQPSDALRHPFCEVLLKGGSMNSPRSPESPRETASAKAKAEDTGMELEAEAEGQVDTKKEEDEAAMDVTVHQPDTTPDPTTTGLEGSVSELEVEQGKTRRTRSSKKKSLEVQ